MILIFTMNTESSSNLLFLLSLRAESQSGGSSTQTFTHNSLNTYKNVYGATKCTSEEFTETLLDICVLESQRDRMNSSASV